MLVPRAVAPLGMVEAAAAAVFSPTKNDYFAFTLLNDGWKYLCDLSCVASRSVGGWCELRRSKSPHATGLPFAEVRYATGISWHLPPCSSQFCCCLYRLSRKRVTQAQAKALFPNNQHHYAGPASAEQLGSQGSQSLSPNIKASAKRQYSPASAIMTPLLPIRTCNEISSLRTRQI